MGPEGPRSTSFTPEEEATVLAFRQHTLLPLDNCLGPNSIQHALRASIPHLTRSSLHPCLQRHGISRLAEAKGEPAQKRAFKEYPIGYFHIDIAEVRTGEGNEMTGHPLYLFVAVDRAPPRRGGRGSWRTRSCTRASAAPARWASSSGSSSACRTGSTQC